MADHVVSHQDGSDRIDAPAPWPAPAQDLESVAQRSSMPWPERLRWARHQLPLMDDVDDRLAAWQRVVDPGDTGQFGRRLDLGGLSIDQARVAVGPVASTEPTASGWLSHFRAFRDACMPTGSTHGAEGGADDSACLQWLAEREAQWPPAATTVPFAHLLWPAVLAAWSRLERDHPNVLERLGPDAVDDLRLALLARLGELVGPTLARGLAEGLTFGERLLARIGDEPEDPPRVGYARAVHQLAAGGLDDELLAHPVLPSLIGIVIRQWHEATVEMLTRVARHRGDLLEHLGVDESAVIARVAVTAGDRHNDGRAVAILTLGGMSVVYKPRDCRLEHLWERAVGLLNGHLTGDGLRAARTVVSKDGIDSDYGFAEFIEHTPCTTRAETSRFYVNAGRTLALLYALSATDCHFENLVAHGDQLVLVDAEALVETRSTRMQVVDVSDERFLPTVLHVGMLPGWLWLDGERIALDITALGCSAGGTERTSSRGWRAINTDAMSRGRVSVPAPHPVSLPTPPGVRPDLPSHVEEMARGFAEGYRAVMDARTTGLIDLLEGARPLSRRLIQRPTYVYAALLAQSREPEALRSVVARGMVLEQLTRAYLAPQFEQAWPLLQAEQQAMARLDVPIFEAALDGSRTWCRDTAVADWPGADALAVVLSRVSRLDEEDLAWQSRLIRASVTAHEFPASSAGDDAPQPATVPPRTPVEMAGQCRDRIAGDARRSGDTVTWMTLGMLPDGEKANVQEVGSGLYDGALGIAVFLHECGAHGMAEAAIGPLLAELDPDDPARARRQLLAVGLGLNGAGGYLRAIRLLARRGHLDPAAADRAVGAIIRATAVTSVSGDQHLDLMGGVAGLIAPLAAERADGRLAEHDRARAAVLVRAAAERLLAAQVPDGGWKTLPGSAPLTGVAHGASGIALALAEAATCLDEPRYADAAARALAFEDDLFDAGSGNWPDLRDTAHGGFMLGWCAGAPGIALARMRLIELLPGHPDAERWRADLEIGATTAAHGPLLSRDHLCCGNLGRAAILSTLGARLDQPAWTDGARRIVEDVLSRAGDGLPRSFFGTRADVLTIPGLMTGQAGAGLLLLGDPEPWAGALLL